MGLCRDATPGCGLATEGQDFLSPVSLGGRILRRQARASGGQVKDLQDRRANRAQELRTPRRHVLARDASLLRRHRSYVVKHWPLPDCTERFGAIACRKDRRHVRFHVRIHGNRAG